MDFFLNKVKRIEQQTTLLSKQNLFSYCFKYLNLFLILIYLFLILVSVRPWGQRLQIFWRIRILKPWFCMHALIMENITKSTTNNFLLKFWYINKVLSGEQTMTKWHDDQRWLEGYIKPMLVQALYLEMFSTKGWKLHQVLCRPKNWLLFFQTKNRSESQPVSAKKCIHFVFLTFKLSLHSWN